MEVVEGPRSIRIDNKILYPSADDMCNRYQIRTNLHSICHELSIQSTFDFVVPDEVFPYAQAPVVAINRAGARELRPMAFGMGKQNSGAAGRAHVLNNTRIESREKWPWKKSFEKYRCVIPMTSFREPCYWGETEGTEVSFSERDDTLLLAAGVFSFSKGATENPDLAMSLIMRPALPYVMEHGHHRSPFFLRREGIDAWMERDFRPADDSIEILREYADEPSLKYEIDRHMAASWVKRKSANLRKRDQEVAAIAQTGPMGFG